MGSFGDWLLRRYKLIAATTAALIAASMIYDACTKFGNTPAEISRLRILALIGALVGWVIGIWLSPYSPAEESKFLNLKKAIGVFFSGYLLARFDDTLDRMLEPQFIFTSNPDLIQERLVVVAAAMLSVVVVFTHRQYRKQDEADLKREKQQLDTKKEDLALQEEALHTREVELKTREDAIPE